MNKQHFDQLVKGVREMKRHMAGKAVRGARTTELIEPRRACDPRGSADQSVAVRETDRGEFAHLAELGAATHETNGAGAGAAEDRGVESEVGD